MSTNYLFFPQKMIYLGVLKSTATTCACVRGRVGVSECGGEVGVGSLGGSRPARNFHFRRNYTSIPYLDPIPRSCSNFSAENLILSTQRICAGGDLAEKGSFTIVKCIAAQCFFETGGDLAEKSSFTIGKRIAAECFLKWGAILQKKAVLQEFIIIF